MSIDLSAANVVREQAQAHWKMIEPMLTSGEAAQAWIHIAWAILEEREECAKVADQRVAAWRTPQDNVQYPAECVASVCENIASAIRSRHES